MLMRYATLKMTISTADDDIIITIDPSFSKTTKHLIFPPRPHTQIVAKLDSPS